jgi:hypothetical protein
MVEFGVVFGVQTELLNNVYEAQNLLGYTAVFLTEYRPTFEVRAASIIRA